MYLIKRISFQGIGLKAQGGRQRTLKWGFVLKGDIQSVTQVLCKSGLGEKPSAQPRGIWTLSPDLAAEISTLMFRHPPVFVRVTALGWGSSPPPGTAAQPCSRRGPAWVPLAFPKVDGDLGSRSPGSCLSALIPLPQQPRFSVSHPNHDELQDLAAPGTPLCSWGASAQVGHRILSPASRAEHKGKRSCSSSDILCGHMSLW